MRVFYAGCGAYGHRWLWLILLSCCLPQPSAASAGSIESRGKLKIPPKLAAFKECTDIAASSCEDLKQLENCTVVFGRVIFFVGNWTTCNINEYSFPQLREITNYMIFYDLKQLQTLDKMFPNLVVIRGRSLYLNYALGLTDLDNLKTVAFPSLTAIQRGLVMINRVPALCGHDQIDFNVITRGSLGRNYIQGTRSDDCEDSKLNCQGCPTEYCWSQNHCYHADNFKDCHEQCLGGCYGSTAKDCVVCRILTFDNECVADCPANSYYVERYQRCYTRNECIQRDFLIHENDRTCVRHCPSGYKADETTKTCVKCSIGEPCINMCSSMQLDNMEALYSLRGCEIINGSLSITLRSDINAREIKHAFAALREIGGYLKIYRNNYLRSLDFLENLRVIHGNPLENNATAIIIFDNPKLQQLWNGKDLTIKTGDFYIHKNPRLCNHVIEGLLKDVNYKLNGSFIQSDEEEVLCGANTIDLELKVMSHRSINLIWPKANTNQRSEIVYRRMEHNEVYNSDEEFSTVICERVQWQHMLIFADDLKSLDQTNYVYQLDNLDSNQRYAILVRTFGESSDANGRSDIKYATTFMDAPYPPEIRRLPQAEVENFIVFELSSGTYSDKSIEYYEMVLHEPKIPLERDYCANHHEPLITNTASVSYSWDHCCELAEARLNDAKLAFAVSSDYRCTQDARQMCDMLSKDFKIYQRYNRKVKNFTMGPLEPNKQYTFEVRSCNAKDQCSNPILHVEDFKKPLTRPNYTACAVNAHVERVLTNKTSYIFNITSAPEIDRIQAYQFVCDPDLINETLPDLHTTCLPNSAALINIYHVEFPQNCAFLRAAAISYVGSVYGDWLEVAPCSTDVANKIVNLPIPIDQQESSGDYSWLKPFGLIIVTVLIFAGIGYWQWPNVLYRNQQLINWLRTRRQEPEATEERELIERQTNPDNNQEESSMSTSTF